MYVALSLLWNESTPASTPGSTVFLSAVPRERLPFLPAETTFLARPVSSSTLRNEIISAESLLVPGFIAHEESGFSAICGPLEPQHFTHVISRISLVWLVAFHSCDLSHLLDGVPEIFWSIPPSLSSLKANIYISTALKRHFVHTNIIVKLIWNGFIMRGLQTHEKPFD